METDLNKLRDRAYKIAKAHGFHEKEYSDETYLMLIITEIAEAVNADRKGLFHYIKHFSNEKEIKERWMPINGYENEYEVSNLGRVRSKNLLVWNGSAYYIKKGRILKAGLGGTGYYTVSLKGKTHKVARLVAESFLTKNSERDCVNHIDGNKKNDNLGNLEFISLSQNNRHAYITGLHNCKSYEKLSFEQRYEIAFLHKMGLAYSTIYKNNNYGVSESCIQKVCNEYLRYTDCVEMELADVVIRLLDFAGAKGINFEEYDILGCDNNFCGDNSFCEKCYYLCRLVGDNMNYPKLEHKIKVILADILQLAKRYDIDLFRFIDLKMKYNELRPYKNGKEY